MAHDSHSQSSAPSPFELSPPCPSQPSPCSSPLGQTSSSPSLNSTLPLSDSVVGENPNPNVDGIEEEDSSITRKRKNTNVVWDHFDKVKINDEWKAMCRYCKKVLGADSKNGSRHLNSHVNSCSKRRHVEMRQKVLVNCFNKAERKVQVGDYSFQPEIVRRKLATMIIAHEYPLSMVDHVWFREYSCALQPLFEVPTRNIIRSDIMKIFNEEKTIMKRTFENLSCRVAITMDMWTSSNQKKGFMAVTSHYVDDSWTLQSRIIRFVYVPCPHTSEVLCEVLWRTLMEWNIDTKLSTITVDNCSTNDVMMDSLLRKFNSESLLLKGNLIHMRCVAHILNLIVKDGLDIIKEGVEKIREVVAYWKGTPKREEKFLDWARSMNVPCDKNLQLDCPTRWNSTFAMLQTALHYKEVLERASKNEYQLRCLPSVEEWWWARDICERLKIFNDVTKLFSGTKYPTFSLYYLKLCEIKMALKKWQCEQNLKIKQMAQKMIEKFDKYWTRIHGIMGVASVLDPRYKMSLVEFYSSKLYGSGAASEYEIEQVRKLCYNMFEEYQLRQCKPPSRTSTVALSSSTTQSTISYSDEFEAFLMEKRRRSTSKSELDHYLEDVCLDADPDFDILAWWKVTGNRYPTLKLMARDILAIPVSTVASESSFITGGRLVNLNRSRLHPNTVEALMCAQNWLWDSRFQGKLQDYATVYEDEENDIHDIDEKKELGEVSQHISIDEVFMSRTVDVDAGVGEK